MTDNNDFQSKIVKVLLSHDNSLETLAKIAGADPKTFYRTANFREADLSSENLSKFDLENAQLPLEARLFDELVKNKVSLIDSQKVRVRCQINARVHFLISDLNYLRLSSSLEKSFVKNADAIESALEHTPLLDLSKRAEKIVLEELEVHQNYKSLKADVGVMYNHSVAFTLKRSISIWIGELSRSRGHFKSGAVGRLVYILLASDPSLGLVKENRLGLGA